MDEIIILNKATKIMLNWIKTIIYLLHCKMLKKKNWILSDLINIKCIKVYYAILFYQNNIVFKTVERILKFN